MQRAPALVVAAVQYPIDRLASFAAVEAKLDRWVGRAAGEGASLVVFPEYAAMEIAGVFDDATAGDLARSLAVVADAMAEMDAMHVAIARRHGVHLLAGSGPCRRGDGRAVNAARLVTPEGRIGIAEKLILTPFEHDWGVAGGGPVRVFETVIGRIGVLICYDSEFPLLARAQIEAGAEVLVIPSCTERTSGANRIRTAALARALEGSVATVTSPTVGLAPWSPAVDRNTGAAGIFVPAEASISDTGVIAEGVADRAQLVVGRVDLEALKRLRSIGEMRNVSDWASQPGAGPLPPAEVVDLR